MPKQKIEFYEDVTNKNHKAFWIQDGYAIEFKDRNQHEYPLDQKKYKKLRANKVEKQLMSKLQSTGIDYKSGRLEMEPLDQHLKYNYANEINRSEKIIDDMLSDMNLAVGKKLKMPPKMRRNWPELVLAKYKWEFLRRSKKFHYHCNNLLLRRAEYLFETAWCDKNFKNDALSITNTLRNDLRNFSFIWGIPTEMSVNSALLFSFYEQDFNELLVNVGVLILINNGLKKNIRKTINSWSKNFIIPGTHPSRGYPGPRLSVKAVGPHSNISTKNGNQKHSHKHYIEFILQMDQKESVSFQKALSKSGLYIFNAEEQFFKSKKYQFKFRVALPGFPRASLFTIAARKNQEELITDIYSKVEHAVADSIGVVIPYVDPNNEMRFDALDAQIEILDDILDWEPYIHEKERSYYKWKNSAENKIKNIEVSAKKRKKLI